MNPGLGKELKWGNIEGIVVENLEVNIDDRGLLSEICRIDNPNVFSAFGNSPIKQVYIVQNFNESIRAFHKHRYLVDVFILVRGHAKFIFCDDRESSSTYETMEVLNVSDKKLQSIIVPTGIYHGWKGNADSMLVCVANQLYKGSKKEFPVDEERIPWNSFGIDIWKTKFK